MKTLFLILSLILGIFPFKEGGARFGAGEKQVFVVHYKWGVLNADVARVTCECDSIMYRGVPAYKAKIYGKTEKFCEAIVKVREDFQGTFRASDFRPFKSSRKAQEAKFNGGETYKYDWAANKLEMNITTKGGDKKKNFDLEPGVLDVNGLYFAVRSIDIAKVSNGKPFSVKVAVGDNLEKISMRYDGREMLQARGVDKAMAHKFRISVTSGNTFDNKSDIILWISDDEHLIPLYFEAPMRLGKVVGRLESSTGK